MAFPEKPRRKNFREVFMINGVYFTYSVAFLLAALIVTAFLRSGFLGGSIMMIGIGAIFLMVYM
jgi:uncharacterized membrane protein YcjF (UPF0283 family)